MIGRMFEDDDGNLISAGKKNSFCSGLLDVLPVTKSNHRLATVFWVSEQPQELQKECPLLRRSRSPVEKPAVMAGEES